MNKLTINKKFSSFLTVILVSLLMLILICSLVNNTGDNYLIIEDDNADIIQDPKSATVVANFFKGVPYNVLKDWNCIRKFHPIECERLQTIPENFTEGVSNTQRYKMIGNGFTIDVIAHILKNIKDQNEKQNL